MAAIKSNEGRRVTEATIRSILNRHDDLFIRVTGAKGIVKWTMKADER